MYYYHITIVDQLVDRDGDDLFAHVVLRASTYQSANNKMTKHLRSIHRDDLIKIDYHPSQIDNEVNDIIHSTIDVGFDTEP
jgi:hypothetical protein